MMPFLVDRLHHIKDSSHLTWETKKELLRDVPSRSLLVPSSSFGPGYNPSGSGVVR